MNVTMDNGANAVIYARYSSHNQTERSIEGQLQDCHEYAKRCGLNVIGEYIDRAMTGTNDNRNDFQKMIADATKKQFQFIIVYKLDRFARNRYDSAIYKNKIKKYGVRVISAMEQISDSPEGIILESVLEGMAEYYSANLSQNVKRGIRVAIENKLFTGGRVPYGFKVVNKKVEIDENQKDTVIWIFNQFANGMHKKEILRQLKANGCKNSSGADFTYNTLHNMLTNKKYIGILPFEGEEISDFYPKIIDTDTFNKVQDRIAAHRRAPAAPKALVKYYLQGKAFCGYCGAPMVGDVGTSRNGTKYHYYSCASHKKRPSSCHKKRERKDFIEWYIVERTIMYVLTPKKMNLIAENVSQLYANEFNESNERKLEIKIAALDRKLDSLIDLALNAKNKSITQKIDERACIIEAQKKELSIELAKLRLANKVKLTKDDIMKWLKSFCDGDLSNEAFRARIIDTFINSIYLFDDKIVIYYNIKNTKQVSYLEMIDDFEISESNPSSCKKCSDLVYHAPPNKKDVPFRNVFFVYMEDDEKFMPFKTICD